jgi:hypothetical protein
LPDGALLAVFARADFELGVAQLWGARSLDEGRTWLPPVLAGTMPLPPDVVDPETGIPLPQPGFPSAAVAPDGSVYVAFEDNRSLTAGGIGVARSRDGGRTWSSAPLPGITAFAFEPAIAVDSHGTVGVTWYDLRNDRPGDAALTADVWFAHSQDRGGSWRQTTLPVPPTCEPHHFPATTTLANTRDWPGFPAVEASPRSSPWRRRRPKTGRPTSSSPGSVQANRLAHRRWQVIISRYGTDR